MANKEPSPTSPLIKKPLSIDLTQSASKSAPIPPSPPDQLPTKLIPYFTKSQFAVALIIQGSKPEGLSVKGIAKSPCHRYITDYSRLLSATTKVYKTKSPNS